MTFSSVQHIWNPETGILPLPDEWESLHVADFDAVRAEWQMLRARIGEGPQLQEALNQLYREWAIETGAIENLYDIERGVTESLILKGISTDLMEHGSVDRDPEYIKNLIDDQRAALDGLFDFIKSDRPLSTSYIKELHSVMTRSQEEVEARTVDGERVKVRLSHGAWKIHTNYPIRNGVSYHYCPPEQVESEMEKLVSTFLEYEKSAVTPDVLAAWIHHRFTQIHPFQDGNGRIARCLATLVLVKSGVEPLVISRDDRAVYLSALELADAGNLRPMCLTVARRVRAQFVRTNQRINQLVAFSFEAKHPIDKIRKILLADQPQEPARERSIRWAMQTLEQLLSLVKTSIKSRLEELDDDRIAYSVDWGGESITPAAIWAEVEAKYPGETIEVVQAKSCRMNLAGKKFMLRIEQLALNPDLESFTCLQWSLFIGDELVSKQLQTILGKVEGVALEEDMLLQDELDIDQWFWDSVSQALIR